MNALPPRPPARPALARRRLLALLPPVALAACAQGGGLPLLELAPQEGYLLGVGDQVRVVTYGEEQLSDDYRVGDRGTIAVPLLGTVRAAGLSADGLAASLATLLRDRKILRAPSVSVEITAYRPVFVLGEVARPGPYPFQPGMTMLIAITIAGGFTYRAVQDHAVVIRRDGTREVTGRVLRGSFLQPGDVMTVYERYF